MADPKGFLNTPRQDATARPVDERIKDWREVYPERALLPIISKQAGRCMDCGIPFCHNGCPLGNLIPEWNDRVWRSDWRGASELLHATNNFPEFTGRACPAPCESACVLGISQPAVTIKNVELSIIDEAWERGLVTPQPPDRLSGKTVAVVGSGPAGLAAAQQLTRAGHTVAVFERDDRIGGLLRYGIPDFKLEKRHINRRIEQMRAEGTRFRTGVRIGEDITAAELRHRYDAVVLATGATRPRDVDAPGRDLPGIHFAMEYLTYANKTNEGDFTVSPIDVAGKHVVVIGGGDTGSDCIGTAHRQGAASVTQIDVHPEAPLERPESTPWPTWPNTLKVKTSSSHEEGGERIYRSNTVEFLPGEDGRVRALRLVQGTRVRGGFVPDEDAQPQEIPADFVFLAIGFSGPETGGLVEQFGLELTPRGTIARGEDYSTNVDGVFATGDAGRGQSLIVWAIAEGRAAAAAVDRYLGGAGNLPAPVKPSDQALTA
ncbi:glutamate synthase subunit beta [Allostreptomyces psammosilenae]|uniref:Glutamate synthase (NADPH/NADH) small chain n=1 Tax=Allostreptomyces psammosilenae TaxID=1892865 RepID=A0A852ZXP0_9ACTN|nr:glutamate synthase subunit beta [Allostreptomyces psammosilenae]NYI07153.1 glutamate synthase (NADPH/NADH) small chain [Allostreptomyces psammosilenae]